MDPYFNYVLVIPDFEVADFTPTAGFSPGLMGFEWALQKIVTLPADLTEPALSPEARRNRRALGQGAYRWLPLNLSTLLIWPPEIDVPLQVLFSQDPKTAETIEAWCDTRPIRPLHVSLSPAGKALRPDQLTRRALQAYAEGVINQVNDVHRAAAIRLLRNWRPQRHQRSTLRFESHNVTVANEMVLLTEGIQPSRARPLNPTTDRDYIRAIRDSVRAVRALRNKVRPTPAARAFPPRPDLVLFAPAMFKALYGRGRADGDEERAMRAAFRTIQRQMGYALRTDRKDEIAVFGKPAWFAINGLRSRELRIQSGGVGIIAASTLAASIRLPPSVNRIRGVISTLADHLRAHPEAQPKTPRVFAAVQSALTSAIDPALLDLIRSTESGVRVVADVPIEWLPVDGLPLFLRFETSRIGATPGNLSFGQLTNRGQIVVPPEVFDEILHIRAFQADDPIREDMEIALRLIAPNAGVTIRRVDVQTRDELIHAMNDYVGAVVIIDAHGAHEPDRPGELLIGNERIDAWSLRGHARIPPIVVLSACDTHAVDGSHATVANGFIACGAQSVIGTFLPVRSHDSSVLIARLIMRVKTLVSIMNRRGYSVSWSKVVTYGLRAQLITDIARALGERPGMDEDTQVEVAQKASARMNLGEANWWEDLRADILEKTGWTEAETDEFLQRTISESDVIRYVHMGAPETIIITSADILAPFGFDPDA
jgi:hypothetical protein